VSILEYLLNNPKETDCIEFKKTLYLNSNKSGFIKDIAALSNLQLFEGKYIIMGVQEREDHTCSVVGIEPSQVQDSSIYLCWVNTNIEPDISLKFDVIDVNDLKVFVIKIVSQFNEGPFIIKKNFLSKKDPFNKGDIFIRKGASNSKMNRSNLDKVYLSKQELYINLTDRTLYVNSQGEAELSLSISNTFSQSLSFEACCLKIMSNKDEDLYFGRMLKFKTPMITYEGSWTMDFHLSINSKTDMHGLACFSFSSSDAVIARLNEYGNSARDLKFLLIFKNIRKEEFVYNFTNCSIFAKGEVLRKVKGILAKKNRNM
jgi:hypothetical protein